MTEFWESSFKEKQTMWGFEPADFRFTSMEKSFSKFGVKKLKQFTVK